MSVVRALEHMLQYMFQYVSFLASRFYRGVQNDSFVVWFCFFKITTVFSVRIVVCLVALKPVLVWNW